MNTNQKELVAKDELYAIVWSLEEFTLHKAVPAMADAAMPAIPTKFRRLVR